jgi:hypothetical protein
VTGDSHVDLDSKITELVGQDQPVTITALGGMSALTIEHTTSALFPYVASALVADWDSLTTDEHAQARGFIASAIRTTASGLALSDICGAVVPAAPSLGLGVEVKAALRNRARRRDDQKAAGIASIALRWLTYLAIVNDSARGALVDALSEIALESSEPEPFKMVAAQVAGIAYDMWRDPEATACLSRLVDNDRRSPDAWFALGQARLADALGVSDRESCLQGLGTTVECFEFAASTGEQRPDAVIYGNAVRFIVAWARNSPASMLAEHYQNARTALREYLLLGYGLPEHPQWMRPRFEAETAWIGLITAMEEVANRDPGDSTWYDAGTAISALAEVYRVANTLQPARSHDGNTADALPELIAPQLAAPFVEQADRLDYLSRWLRDRDDPGAQEFAAFVREHAELVVHPKVRPPGSTRL